MFMNPSMILNDFYEKISDKIEKKFFKRLYNNYYYYCSDVLLTQVFKAFQNEKNKSWFSEITTYVNLVNFSALHVLS